MKIIKFKTVVYLILFIGYSTSILTHSILTSKNTFPILTENDLIDQLTHNKGNALFFFFMEHCTFCNMMKPTIEKIANSHNDLQIYMVHGIDLQAHRHLKDIFDIQIQGYPVILFMKNKKLKETQIGLIQLQDLQSKIKKIFLSS